MGKSEGNNSNSILCKRKELYWKLKSNHAGGVENALEIFHPRNIRNYVKTLSSDDYMRKVLSTEFQGLLEAARQARQRLEEPQQLLPEDNI